MVKDVGDLRVMQDLCNGFNSFISELTKLLETNMEEIAYEELI